MAVKAQRPLEILFFEKFFLERIPFTLSRWKGYEDLARTTIQSSIVENVSFILNTINSLKIEEYLKKKLTFLDFGVPDFYSLYQTNSIATKTIEACIKHAIASFEPRILQMTVKTEIKANEEIIVVGGKVIKSDGNFFQIAYCNLKK